MEFSVKSVEFTGKRGRGKRIVLNTVHGGAGRSPDLDSIEHNPANLTVEEGHLGHGELNCSAIVDKGKGANVVNAARTVNAEVRVNAMGQVTDYHAEDGQRNYCEGSRRVVEGDMDNPRVPGRILMESPDTSKGNDVQRKILKRGMPLEGYNTDGREVQNMLANDKSVGIGVVACMDVDSMSCG